MAIPRLTETARIEGKCVRGTTIDYDLLMFEINADELNREIERKAPPEATHWTVPTANGEQIVYYESWYRTTVQIEYWQSPRHENSERRT